MRHTVVQEKDAEDPRRPPRKFVQNGQKTKEKMTAPLKRHRYSKHKKKKKKRRMTIKRKIGKLGLQLKGLPDGRGREAEKEVQNYEDKANVKGIVLI